MRRGVFLALTLGLVSVMLASAATKGTVGVSLKKPVYVDGKSIGPGPCQIAWVTHSPEASVKFTVGGDVVVEAHGRFVERDEKSPYDGVVTAKDASGNDVVKEVWFAGKKSVLVLE